MPPETYDDTGMHLSIAVTEEQNGNLKIAHDVRRNIFSARLNSYKKFYLGKC